MTQTMKTPAERVADEMAEVMRHYLEEEEPPTWWYREQAILELVNGLGHTYDSEGRRLD